MNIHTLFVVFFLSSLQFLSAQTAANSLIDGKTVEEVIDEYRYWSRVKNDWANLKFYQEANDTICQPALNEQRVVFMGNSITQAWRRQSPDFFVSNSFIGKGISGQTTPQMLLRFRQDVINLNPKLVVILAGTNDIAGNTGPASLEMIADNIYSMAELSLANNIKVILTSVLPAKQYPWRPELHPADSIIQLNKLLESYANKHDVKYVDYFNAMVDDENGLNRNYSSDGVHPNKDGYSVMESIIKPAIIEVLEKMK